jgi:hypothetical protein
LIASLVKSTVQNNIDILLDLHREQAGIPQEAFEDDPVYLVGKTSNWIWSAKFAASGNMGAKYDMLDYVVVVLGLFHAQMHVAAAITALHRVKIQSQTSVSRNASSGMLLERWRGGL